MTQDLNAKSTPSALLDCMFFCLSGQNCSVYSFPSLYWLRTSLFSSLVEEDSFIHLSRSCIISSHYPVTASSSDKFSLHWTYDVNNMLIENMYFYIFCDWKVSSKWSIGAGTWQNQQNGCASSEDSYQPGHPPSPIRLRCPHEESLGPAHWAHTDDFGHLPSLIRVFAVCLRPSLKKIFVGCTPTLYILVG